MHRSLIIFVLFLAAFHSFGSNGSKADSLESLLKQPLADTGRISVYQELARELAHRMPDKAISYINEGLTLARKGGHRKSEAALVKELGIVTMYNGGHSKAIGHFITAMKLFEELKDRKGIAACNGNIGIVYWYQKDHDRSIEYYKKALSEYELLGDKMGVANQYNNIGLVYSDRKKYDEAIALYMRSLAIYEELGNQQGVSKRLNNIGIVYEEKGDFGQAMDHYRKAIEIRKKIDDKQGMAISLNNLGDLLSKTNRNAEAIRCLEQSLAISNEIGFLEGQRYSYEYLANACARASDHKKAFEYHRLFTQVNDSIRGIEVYEQVTELEAKYQNEKKEKEIASLKVEKAQQELSLIREKAESRVKTLIIAVISLSLITLLFILRSFHLQRKAREKEIRTQIADYIREIQLLNEGILSLSPPAALPLEKEDLNTRLVNPLTDREVEVIRLVGEGRSNKEIAGKLFISENTVKYHLKNIYEKLDAKNRTEALVKAGAMNLVPDK